ncbi:MAG: hypothetical protein NXI18_07105 [Alphaproteobacteria bacterium]|nr:hypothetical protein [Alphaproteobacteria bacterium]
MFSITKLVALAAIIGAVWFGFRLIGRLDAARKAKVKQANAGPRPDEGGRRGSGRDGSPAHGDVVDLVRDERTGEYVARDRRDDRT